MVPLFLILITAVTVVAIGLVFVGSAVNKTANMPNQIVIDAHEAIDFVGDAIPTEVSSVLSYEDVRRLIRLHTEWIQAYHWAPDNDSDGPIVFEEFDPVDYVMERADLVGLEVERDHAAAVIEANSAYLQFMGAIHLDDPVKVRIDIEEMPLLDAPYEPPKLGAGETQEGDLTGGEN